MAKELKLPKGKEYTFRDTKGGGVSKYPWDKWFDGTLWLLEQDYEDESGKAHKGDYDVPTTTMPNKLRAAARKQYKIVQIGRFDADGNRLEGSLVIKARDMTEEERQAEDLLRAQEEAAARERKAEKKRIVEAGKRALAEQQAPKIAETA